MIERTEHVRRFLERVKFRGWRFVVGELGDSNYLQVEFDDVDKDTSEDVICKGRRWLISTEATDEEIVKTCWVAVELALRHEAMEDFTYFGVRPFHPHTDIAALVAVQLANNPVHRPDPAVAVVKRETPNLVGDTHPVSDPSVSAKPEKESF